MYVAQWSDPDLGDYGNDFAGSDVDLSLGYVYNGEDEDSYFSAFGLHACCWLRLLRCGPVVL